MQNPVTKSLYYPPSLGSGAIEFNEFLPLMAKEMKSRTASNKEVQEAFRCFDQNGDGVITGGCVSGWVGQCATG